MHCIIIPSYNAGALLAPTLQAALKHGHPVFLVIDGSTDGSEESAQKLLFAGAPLEILKMEANQGKGAAVLAGLRAAQKRGFTHALVFDSDGQHDASDIPRMLEVSRRHPEAMVLGDPIFGPDAPPLRVKGRRLGNWFTHLETLWGGIGDSLFGFRIYPVTRSIQVLESISGGRRFDFETQLAVRLYWSGVPAINYPSRVNYPARALGGVSHFDYLRDNLLLTGVHLQLTLRSLFLLPRLLRLRLQNSAYRSGIKAQPLSPP